jgi:hypothetical protein
MAVQGFACICFYFPEPPRMVLALLLTGSRYFSNNFSAI